MLNSTKIDLRRSEVAQELNDLSAKDELTAEDRSKMADLTAEVTDLETRFRAALTAEEAIAKSVKDAPVATGLPDEDKELAELRSKCSFGRAVKRALDGHELEGAEAELRSHFLPGAAADVIPLELMADKLPRVGRVEERAVDSSDIISQDTNFNIWARMFVTPSLDFLDIAPSPVPVGRASYQYLRSGAVPAITAEGNSATDATIGETSTSYLLPTRVAARYDISEQVLFQVEDLEDMLAADLRAALSDAIEATIFSSNTIGNGGNGLQHGSHGIGPKIPTTDTYLSDKQTYNEVASEAHRWVEGWRATGAQDIRFLVPTTAYELAGGLFQTNGDANALETLNRTSGGVRVTTRITDATSGARSTNNLTDFIVYRTGRPDVPWYAFPMWNGLRVSRDDQTLRVSGEVRLVADVYMDFNLRPAQVGTRVPASEDARRAALAWGSWRKS